jgi:hypothetical protein
MMQKILINTAFFLNVEYLAERERFVNNKMFTGLPRRGYPFIISEDFRGYKTVALKTFLNQAKA